DLGLVADGMDEGDVLVFDVDGPWDDRASGIPIVGGDDAQRVVGRAGIRLQQVCTRIGRSAYVVDELCLHGGNLVLDLGAFLSTRGLGEQNLRLDVIDHVDGIVHGGVNRVDLACAQAERVLHDRIRLVV